MPCSYKIFMGVYDLIIIGAGPAGMTAGIYASRKEMKTLVISQDVGGQMSKTAAIENYPGVEKIDGVALAFKIKKQVEGFGAEFITDKVKEIKQLTTHSQQLEFEVIMEDNKKFRAKSIILAFGLEKRKLGLANEEKFIGNGLSYCVTCDGPMYRDENVAVVGGGNAGAEAVEFLAKICPKVYWLEVMDKINADEILVNRISKLKNIKIMTSVQVAELIGKDKLESIKIKPADSKIGEEPHHPVFQENIHISGLFVEIGYTPKSDWLKKMVDLDKRGQIKVDNLCHTNMPGIFAAGDCTDTKYKQIVIAEGQGAIAALEAYEYVNK